MSAMLLQELAWSEILESIRENKMQEHQVNRHHRQRFPGIAGETIILP